LTPALRASVAVRSFRGLAEDIVVAAGQRQGAVHQPYGRFDFDV